MRSESSTALSLYNNENIWSRVAQLSTMRLHSHERHFTYTHASADREKFLTTTYEETDWQRARGVIALYLLYWRYIYTCFMYICMLSMLPSALARACKFHQDTACQAIWKVQPLLARESTSGEILIIISSNESKSGETRGRRFQKLSSAGRKCETRSLSCLRERLYTNSPTRERKESEHRTHWNLE